MARRSPRCYRWAVRNRPPPLLLLAIGLALLAGLAVGTHLWLSQNPFADGYQNEYLHAGNAHDLWGAFRRWDTWHLRYYTSQGYWPPLFHVVTWPLLGALGARHEIMVLANVGWLAVAFVAVAGLARDRAAGAGAIVLLALSPGIFGSLVRYEPNVAQTACLALGLLALRRSEGFTRPGWSLATGGAVALGLLTDRLGTLPFLAVPMLLALGGAWRRPAARRPALRGLVLAALVVLVAAGPWYVQWVLHQFAEVQEQLPVGEIDSTGELTEAAATGMARWLYYPLALLDGQAGPVLGLVMLAGLLLRPRRDLLATTLWGWVLFTFIQKKQVFYTLPLLAPLAVVGAEGLRRLGPLYTPLVLVLLSAGLHQYAGRMWAGGLPVLRVLAEPDPLPAAWVSPRHTLARPPSGTRWPEEELVRRLEAHPGDLVIFSDDPVYWEGYLHLRLRERLPDRSIRSLRLDPQGTWEWFRSSDRFLVVSATPGWPATPRIAAALRQDHYLLDDLPPLLEMVRDDAPAWHPDDTLPLQGEVVLTSWRRAPEAVEVAPLR